jgi:hypothetical protein
MTAYNPPVYTADGLTDTFSIPFSYIDPAYVKVTVDGVAATFTFPSAGQVHLTSMPTNGQKVKVYRDTNKTSRLVTWNDGSTVTGGDLNTSSQQDFDITQENYNEMARRLPLNATDTAWDAGSKKVTNVANGTTGNDAVNYSQTQQIVADATTQANAAAASAGAASTSATLAQDWATKTSGQVAATDYSSKEFAQGSQASTGGSSKNWAQQAGADVTGAAANSRSAKSWAQDNLTGATLGGSAKDWAQSASLPDAVNKSAKSYATDASTQATNAASSATAAATSAAQAAATVAGLSLHNSVKCATTATLTVTYANGTAGVGATLTNAGAQAAFAVDGVTPSVGDRVLVKDQSTTFQNGIYTLTTAGSGATNWVLTPWHGLR